MKSIVKERPLGVAGPVVGPLGVGTWAMGGPFYSGAGCHYPTGVPLGYGQVDENEVICALHCAIDLGAILFDTADAYGTGQAESLLGQALQGKRQDLVIATKFGNTLNRSTRELTGTDVSPRYIRQACEASLRRLRTDWIDLYQLHLGDLPIGEAIGVADTLDRLCDEGLIRAYAWSTDDPERAALFAARARVPAVQFDMNVFQDAPAMLALCDKEELAAIIRQPLAMGFLSGKHGSQDRRPSDDIRSRPPSWLPYYRDGGGSVEAWNKRLANITEILKSGGRSLVQGALAWIWARSDRTIPIPGLRTVAQAEENFAAVALGALSPDQMQEIEKLLDCP